MGQLSLSPIASPRSERLRPQQHRPGQHPGEPDPGADGHQYLNLAYGSGATLDIRDGFLDHGQSYQLGGVSLSQSQFLAQYAPALNLAGTTGDDALDGSRFGDVLNGGYGNDRKSDQTTIRRIGTKVPVRRKLWFASVGTGTMRWAA